MTDGWPGLPATHGRRLPGEAEPPDTAALGRVNVGVKGGLCGQLANLGPYVGLFHLPTLKCNSLKTTS